MNTRFGTRVRYRAISVIAARAPALGGSRPSARAPTTRTKGSLALGFKNHDGKPTKAGPTAPPAHCAGAGAGAAGFGAAFLSSSRPSASVFMNAAANFSFSPQPLWSLRPMTTTSW